MKHYLDIERLKQKDFDLFSKGELIIIEEKIDGANASFTYNQEKNEVIAFSRKQQLSSSNNLRGYWKWVQTLDKDIVNQVTMGGKLIVTQSHIYKKTTINSICLTCTIQ